MNRTSKSLFFLAVIGMMAAGVVLDVMQDAEAAARGRGGRHVYRAPLRLTIPYHGLHAREQDEHSWLEVLNPEDGVMGRAERRVETEAAGGTWQQEIAVAKAPGVEELVWNRVRYRFQYADQKDAAAQGTDSISEILRTPVVHVLGQQAYLTGGAAAVRVVVTDSKNEPIAGNGSVRIDLVAPGDHAQALYTGRLNRRGTTEAQFRFPAGVAGNYQLRYVVDTPIGSTDFTQAVRLEEKASILLTTEKPIYQPGQTIHVRALALDRSNHEAAAGRKLTFEVEDPRANKVFKKITQTDQFGVASAEFELADEVNLGTYHVRGLMEGGAATAMPATARGRSARWECRALRVAEVQSGGGVRRQGPACEARLPSRRSRDGHGARELFLRQAG